MKQLQSISEYETMRDICTLLSNKIARDIIMLLANRVGPFHVGAIKAYIGQRQATTSFYLSKLRKYNIVKVKKEGKLRKYSLRSEAIFYFHSGYAKMPYCIDHE